MADIEYKVEEQNLILKLSGRVDTGNVAEVEKGIRAVCANHPLPGLVIDCEKLSYISSAGLRVLLRLRKENGGLELVNVSPEVYDIFEMTGFTEMITVRKAYRMISVEGCEVIGTGANGKVYRLDPETAVKVYLNPDALPEINRERELARTAFVAGVPTAIPYDVVRIEGGGYGSVFELLNASNLAKLLSAGKVSVDEAARISADLLKTIHATVVRPESVPDMRERALDWVAFMKGCLSAGYYEKLHALVDAVPEDPHLLHGDYHLKNIMIQNGEALLIDMDTLCHGHPIFELGSMYNACVGFSLFGVNSVSRFLEIPSETAADFWLKSLRLYLGNAEDSKIREVNEKVQIIGCTRLLRRAIRRGALETEEGRGHVNRCRSTLETLLDRTETLCF